MAEPAVRDRAGDGDSHASSEAHRTQLEKGLLLPYLTMARFTGVFLLFFAASSGLVLAGDSDLKSEEVYQAWLQMYDLKFGRSSRCFRPMAARSPG